jgi:hypothetical protein
MRKANRNPVISKLTVTHYKAIEMFDKPFPWLNSINSLDPEGDHRSS